MSRFLEALSNVSSSDFSSSGAVFAVLEPFFKSSSRNGSLPFLDVLLSLAAPFVGLVAFEVMWSLVVVAARGKDLLELPMLFDR